MPSDTEQPRYKLYRSTPRGLLERLRGEDEAVGGGGQGDEPPRGPRGPWRWPWRRRPGGVPKRVTPLRVLKWLVVAIVGWLLLSLVLFIISASVNVGSLPKGAASQLTGGGPMLTSANTVLLLGLDTRPKTGPGSKEPGSNYSDRNAATDTIMLWRIGGGTSRRLSIPRDTLVNIPGVGPSKINAAWAVGGPALALKVIKRFTGLQINHLIVINLGNFPKFIDDIGGVNVKTGRICSTISGGTANGGFTLNLRPGVHHLDGIQAMVLARTRENACNAASNDLTREGYQQQILNAIKSQLFSFHAFFHLPWAAWDAPGVLETDLGPLQLLELFASAEIGGSAPVSLLNESASVYNGSDVLIPNMANVHAQVQKLLTGN
jgi:LCP family protein required for cell wall assembly